MLIEVRASRRTVCRPATKNIHHILETVDRHGDEAGHADVVVRALADVQRRPASLAALSVDSATAQKVVDLFVVDLHHGYGQREAERNMLFARGHGGGVIGLVAGTGVRVGLGARSGGGTCGQ